MKQTHLGAAHSRTAVVQPLLKQCLTLLAFILVFAAGARTAFGAAITWQTPTTVVGDTDVSTAGTLVYAYNFSSSASTVNGVAFTGNTSLTGAGANLSFSPSFGGNYNGYGSGSNPYNALSSAYKVLLGNANYLDAPGASVTITLSNLTVGRSYAIQYWVNDSRNLGRSETLTSSGGNTVTLSYDATATAGGVGQYSIGTFTANATTQSFIVTQVGGSDDVQINALQLRDTTGIIAWGPATTVVGDTDVSTVGTLVYAYNFSSSSSTVNGVAFTGNSSLSDAGGNMGFSPSFGSGWDGFGSGSNPFNALSEAYKVLLKSSVWRDGDGASVSITLSNLTAGRNYAVQYWVNDSRGSTRTETLTSTGGNTVTLAYDPTQSQGGVGQYSVGTFTANGTTQAFTVTTTAGNNNVQVNAIQVRDTTPITKAASGTDLAAGASWTGGSAPASGNIAAWASSSLGSGLTIGSAVSWLGISAPSAASDIAITGGGVLTLGASGIDMAAAANNLSAGNPITLGASQPWIVNSGKTLTASGSVNGVQAGRFLTKFGGGTLTLSGSTDNGSLRAQVSAGTMILGKTSSSGVHSVGSGGGTDYALIIAGGTAQLGGSGGDQIYDNSAVNMTAGSLNMNGLSETFDGLAGTGGRITNGVSATTATLTLGANNSSGSPAFSGVIANGSGAVALTKIGTGAQTLTGANTYSGSTFVKAGTLVINTGGSVNNTSFNSVGLAAGDNGTLTLQNSGSFTTSAEVNIGDNGTTASPAVGTLNVSGSANLAASFVAVGSAIGGSSAGATGTVNHNGGTVTTSQGGDAGLLVGGRSSGSTAGIGTYNLSSGTVNVNNNGNVWIGGYGKGTNNQTGGTFNTAGWTAIGRQSGGTGVWNLSGGTLNHTGAGTRINVGESGTGTLNVSGSGQATTVGGVRLAASSGGIGTVNLNGGTITTPIVEVGGGASSTFNFNGGTLRASASTATFMQGLTAANVQNGGALIDCQANNITIAQPLLNGGSGGLRKLGTGTLTLTGASTFTGPTIINGNTVVGIPPSTSAGGLGFEQHDWQHQRHHWQLQR
jgi:autotransporter-associated beta strand protein